MDFTLNNATDPFGILPHLTFPDWCGAPPSPSPDASPSIEVDDFDQYVDGLDDIGPFPVEQYPANYIQWMETGAYQFSLPFPPSIQPTLSDDDTSSESFTDIRSPTPLSDGTSPGSPTSITTNDFISAHDNRSEVGLTSPCDGEEFAFNFEGLLVSTPPFPSSPYEGLSDAFGGMQPQCDALVSTAAAEIHYHDRGFVLGGGSNEEIFPFASTTPTSVSPTPPQVLITAPRKGVSKRAREEDDDFHPTKPPRKQNNEPMFECEECGTKFGRSHNLKVHRDDVHLDLRRFKCKEPGCNKAMKRAFDLKRHVQSAHTDGPSPRSKKNKPKRN